MPSRLHHVVVFVTDMDRSVHLLRDLFGLTLDWRIPRIEGLELSELVGIPDMVAEMAYLQCPAEHVAVELIRLIHPQVAPGVNGASGNAGLSFVVEDLDRLHGLLKDEGWEPFTPIVRMRNPEGEWLRMFCFRVEEGLTIELIEPEEKPAD
jgi:catechol 2,3-dioxygenase-like lactoylglutathione lyase family enzyme